MGLVGYTQGIIFFRMDVSTPKATFAYIFFKVRESNSTPKRNQLFLGGLVACTHGIIWFAWVYKYTQVCTWVQYFFRSRSPTLLPNVINYFLGACCFYSWNNFVLLGCTSTPKYALGYILF